MYFLKKGKKMNGRGVSSHLYLPEWTEPFNRILFCFSLSVKYLILSVCIYFNYFQIQMIVEMQYHPLLPQAFHILYLSNKGSQKNVKVHTSIASTGKQNFSSLSSPKSVSMFPKDRENIKLLRSLIFIDYPKARFYKVSFLDVF